MELYILTFMIFLSFMTIIIKCIITKNKKSSINESFNKKCIYDINNYIELKYLDDHLKNNLESIQKESIDALNNKPLLKHKRKQGIWSGNNGKKYIDGLKEGWIYGWTEKNDWLNYPIIHNGKFINNVELLLPILCKYLKNIDHCIYIAGLSVLKGGGKIQTHTDDDQTYELGSLTYHFNIVCPTNNKSIITVDNDEIIQKNGNSLLFDAGCKHSVYNDSDEYRIILFIDFKYEHSFSNK